MYPLTEDFPKPLLKVGEKTILDWIVQDIANIEEIQDIVLVSNHRFISFFEEWRELCGINNRISIVDDGSTHNDNKLGAVKDISLVIDKLRVRDDLLVVAGDNLLDFSLKEFVSYFNNIQKTCVMRYEEPQMSKLKKTGVASVDAHDKLIEMQEKPRIPKSHWAIPPFYIYEKSDLSKISMALEEGCPADAPGYFLSWFCEQADVYAMHMTGRRYDIGSIEGYKEICTTSQIFFV